MTKTELIMSTLEKKGYNPEIDEDGDVQLSYQMKTIYVMTGDEDEPYISVMLPHFYRIDEGEETLVLTVCNKMTREMKLAKVFIDETFNHVSAICDFLYANEEAMELSLMNALKMLGFLRTIFRDHMEELSEEDD